MCSVSLIRPGPGRLRVVMNRDEADDRPAGLPPRGDADAGLPRLRTVDVRGGGAWIGVNAAGLVVCLLNRSVEGDLIPTQAPSRGALVPLALEEALPTGVHRRIAPAAMGRAPFTLVAANSDVDLAMTWDGRELVDLPPADIRCSSGLGDEQVAVARRQVWRALTTTGPTAASQDAWHASRVGDDAAAWVLMRRPGARTISRTVVEVDGDAVTLTETAIDADGADGPSHRLELGRRRNANG